MREERTGEKSWNELRFLIVPLRSSFLLFIFFYTISLSYYRGFYSFVHFKRKAIILKSIHTLGKESPFVRIKLEFGMCKRIHRYLCPIKSRLDREITRSNSAKRAKERSKIRCMLKRATFSCFHFVLTCDRFLIPFRTRNIFIADEWTTEA